MTAMSLTAVAAVAGDGQLASTGLILAMALGGYLTWIWISGTPLAAAAICPAAAGLFALAWALTGDEPALLPGVTLSALILFADGTARRAPLPHAGISVVLYPAVHVGVALLPLALAAVLTAALQRFI